MGTLAAAAAGNRRMSVHVISWVLRESTVDVPGHRLVLLVLADHAEHDGTNACPGVPKIAAFTRLDRSTVQRALRALEAAGHISSHGRHPLYETTIYSVHMGGPQNAAPAANRGGPHSAALPDPSKATYQGEDGSGPRVGPQDAAPNAAPPDRDQKAWALARAELQRQLTDFAWHTYAEHLELAAADEGTWTLTAPGHICTILRERYSETVARAIANALGDAPLPSVEVLPR